MFFFIFILWLGVGAVFTDTSADDSEGNSNSESGFLKSRSAARDLSYSSSFGSEDFDSPDIPSDFHARWGRNKTWYVRTPHPILSRRASYEEYGRPRVIQDSLEASSPELSKSSENIETSIKPVMSTLGTSHLKTRASEPKIHKMSTPGASCLETRVSETKIHKMDKQKRRRGNVIVLKPPPEDWPEPKMPKGVKLPEPDFGATIPPMGTFIDTRMGRKGRGFGASSYASPPYMGHRKIDFVTGAARSLKPLDKDTPTSSTPSVKWRIKGRRDRKGATAHRHQRGGGYLSETGQQPGFMRETRVKPDFSKYFISENTTYLVPTVRHARHYQRSYFNFRMRPPMNVGRAFGPPSPPFPPPLHPHFPPNHPYGQAPFPQFPQAPYPHFPHGPPPPPPFGPPPPQFGHGPPPPYRQGAPPPPFRQDAHFQRAPPPPQFAPPPPQMPQPRGPPDLFPGGPPPPPPSPYPTGPDLPSVRPFLDNIPTVSPINNVPAPWPRRHIYSMQQAPIYPQARVPDFLKQEPRNFSGYKGPRRGRAYEQYGKADLRPRHIKFHDAVRATPPRFPARKGSGFGVDFQEDITRPAYVPGEMFVKKTWPTRMNRFGYVPYRRTSDKKRPYGFGRYAAERPPVLGDFGQFKPYKRLDDTQYVPYNYSRPTRSYTFPPRLRLAIKNASYHRRAFRRSNFQGYTLPTLPSIGLEAYMAHAHDYYGNAITPKGRIMNLHDLKKLFTTVQESDAEAVVKSRTVEDKQKEMMPRITPKPKGMTAREAMRAAAREAMKETEMEAWERGEGDGQKRPGLRRLGGAGGRGGTAVRRGGARGSGIRSRNFRRAKRSAEEEANWEERLKVFKQNMYNSGDYLTGPGATSSSSGSFSSAPRSKEGAPPLRMRHWHTRRSKGRPLRRG